MTDNKTQKSVDYWSRKLTGESHLCTFPYDVRKNHQLRHRLLELVTKFPGPSQQHTEAHYDSRNNDEHLYNFLITVLTILLHKYTGLDDITLGMPILKKTGNPDCPNTTLPLSIQLPQDASFADAYSLACETVTEASDHQEEPVDAESYFDVMTALENCHAEKCIRSIRTTKCDIIFLFNLTAAPDENSRHLQLTLLYDSNLYKSTTIQRLLFHYSRLALSVGADETIRIADMDCLFPNEKKQILETFNFTDYHYPQDSTISQLFEARVKREPERPAVVADDGSPTYEQLNRKAHRLAAGLQRYGVKPDTIIALMIPRSAALITAQLGIMKAGGAFLSIDSQMPEDRIRFILEDCGADILLVYGNEKENEKIGTNETGPEKTGTTGSANEKNNPLSFFNGHIINIKPMVQQEEAGIETDTARAPAITSDNLAYVIYTSGTTGKPKGVLVPHRGIASLTSTFKQLHVTPADRILEFASCSFDASIWEIYMALLTGASSYVVPSEVVEDYDRFAEYLNYHRITIASLPPIYADHLENYEFPHLRVLITAGSAPGIHLVNTWREKLTYFNGYGPTETTICSSLWKAPQRGKAIDTVLIGSPIRNLRIYILDKYMNPVPPGAPGELCIAGESVVRGYLNRPGLTAEKFITNPFSHRISSAVNHAKYNRMYKTGDLGRWLDDGTIEFLGRVDLQINIRGFRVEPGEIEEVIRCHHHITEVTVQALENPDGDVFLCAYMECHPKTEPGEIRALTAHKLPDYMIPTHFIAVEKIPLNTSGKVDKKALPKPSFGTDRDDYSPPSTATEKQLTEIWGEVLSLPTHTIGIDSDFFHLGGHSLKATIMSAKIHKAFNVKIPLSAIFQLLTIRRLAGEIDHTETVAYATVETAETKEYYPLSSPQKRLFILWQMEKESTEYNIQMLDIHEGALNRQRVEDAFKQLIARHDALRTSFLLVDGRGRQKVHIDVPFEMEYQEAVESRSGKDRRIKARQAVVEAAAEKEDRRAPGATFDLPPDSPRHVEHIVKDFVRPFDLSRLPLFRVGLVNVRNSRHVLMLDMHHIISDGISMGIIEREFQQLYDGAVLPAPKHKYVDFAQWQNRAGAKDIIKEQEQFWLDRFSRRIPLLNLPIDFVRPAVRSTDGDTIQFKIHETLTHRLNQLAHDNGTTLYMVLLTAYNILLHKLSGQEDVVVGTVTAGRKHIDLYPIIGMFANTLALRNYPRASATVTELLTDIRTLTLEAFENQDYPFEELAAKTAKRTDTGRNPLFDVTFSLENETEQDDELLEVVIPGKPKAYSFENKKAKFDVSLTAVETEEGLRFSFEYGTRLFKKDTIYRFCEYLKTVLEIVADEQSTPVYQIDMLPDSEKELLLHRFNNTAAPCPHEKTIHQLFEEQALRRPNLPAILGIDAARADEPAESVPLKAVTYDQLNREANQLANRLLTKGVTPGTIIAMCTPRSTQMIVGILGILKAGAAYLPIDPQYPEQRIKYLLSDSNAQLTVTAGTFHEDLFKHTAMIHLAGTPEIFTESGQAEKERENLTNSAFTPAYIIYTSGTTGRPKGVIIEHRQAVNTLTCRRDRYKLGPAVTALQLFSYAFDAFVASFFSPIISGAKVLLASDRLLQDITRLKEMIIKHHVSHFISIPQLFKTLLDLFEPGEADCLQTVTLAGDTFPVNLLELAAQKAPRLEIAQEYGVTESAVMSTMQRHQEKEPHITIGSPTWNTRIFIIDAHDNPQPFGVPGELCIASAGNARGYLNKPELTAEKFTAIPKHLQKHENSQSRATAGADTFYRTGDLARWLPDGKLQFLGRIDRQAKIRGFRIETGEIEGRLLSHHAVKEAVVAIKEDRQGEKYLCAY
ncbi:MAG: amino acid adenylation domain-containing protein, partial [bacterium]|nr:amino acid adenylation domain-containing protein [bacterium]